MNIYSWIIHSSQKVETIQMTTKWWMDKQKVYPYNRILFSHKRNKVLICTTSWMELENVVLRGRSQPQKPTYCDSLSQKQPESVNPWRQKADWCLPGAGGRGERGMTAWKYFLWKCLELDQGDGCTTLNGLNVNALFAWKWLILGTFSVVQQLRICLPVQGTQVWSLAGEDSTCHRVTKPTHHNYWTWALKSVSHNKRVCELRWKLPTAQLRPNTPKYINNFFNGSFYVMWILPGLKNKFQGLHS